MRVRTNVPTMIMIHHSWTADSKQTLSWGVIDRNHQARGWDAIGYHAGAEYVRGRVECLYGRPDYYEGAHCRAVNRTALGFCFVGNFDKEPPPEELLTVAAERVIVPWLRQYKLTPLDIVPHSLFDPKTCPGAKFDIERLRRICARILEDTGWTSEA